jgi:hypothetical protein
MSDKPQPQLDKSFSLTRREQVREWASAPPSDDKKLIDRNSPKCAACGKHHTESGITHESAEKNCVRATIVRLRQENAALRTEIESLNLRLRLERMGREPGPKAEIPAVEPEPKSA